MNWAKPVDPLSETLGAVLSRLEQAEKNIERLEALVMLLSRTQQTSQYYYSPPTPQAITLGGTADLASMFDEKRKNDTFQDMDVIDE